MRTKQAVCLRVDQMLYERLSELARTRGTSITRQLEVAVRSHLETALVEDNSTVIRPVLERVIAENLESCVTSKIDEMKERLATLLARNAIDTASLYIASTHRMTDREKAALRKAAYAHVRGRMDELGSQTHTAEEVDALRNEIKQLQAQLRSSEETLKNREENYKSEIAQAQAAVRAWSEESRWKDRLLRWLAQEWDKAGLVVRRRPFHECVQEFARKDPPPKGA